MTMQSVDFETVRTELDNGSNFGNIVNSPWFRDAVYDRFSDAEYQRRWNAVRARMAEMGLDCLIAGGGPSHWSFGGGMMWLSGHWEWHHMAAYVVFPREGEPTLLYGMGGTHLEAVRVESHIKDVRPTGGRFMRVAVERIKELGLENGTIGIPAIDPCFMDYMPFNQYIDLSEGLPNARIEWLGNFFYQFTMIKSPEEQERLAKAGELCANGIRAIAELAAPGVRDYELAAAAGGAMMEGGGQIDFLIIGSTPMSDPKMVFGSPRPSGRVLQKGDIIMMETAAGYYGQTAQFGAPICLGEPPEYIRYLFDEIILPGYLKMAETLKPGMHLSDTYEAGRFFRERGYQSKPIHLHPADNGSRQFPYVSATVPPDPDGEWRPGMTAVLEPNIITPDGSLGLFFGHTHIITEDGNRRVTPYPLQLTVV